MVSAPSGRVCKKKKGKSARAARITTKIRIVIRSTVVPSSRMHPPSPSLFLADARDLVAPRLLCPSSRPLTHVVLSRAPPTSSAFCFLLSNDVVAVHHSRSHPGAECDTRRSLVNVRCTMEKSCVYDVSSTESNFHLRRRIYVKEVAHMCA